MVTLIQIQAQLVEAEFAAALAIAWRGALARDERPVSLAANATEVVIGEFCQALLEEHAVYPTRATFLDAFALAYDATDTIVRGVHIECHLLALALFDLMSDAEPADRYRIYARAHQVLGHAVLALSARRLESMNKVTKRDELTALFNRRSYDVDLVARTSVDDAFVLAMMDMDGLKALNDAKGHDAGSRLICDFAVALQAHVQAVDASASVYRWGGDEFAAILPATSLPDAINALSNLQETSSFSFGCSAYPAETADLKRLSSLADERMYEQKRRRKIASYSLLQRIVLAAARKVGVAR